MSASDLGAFSISVKKVFRGSRGKLPHPRGCLFIGLSENSQKKKSDEALVGHY